MDAGGAGCSGHPRVATGAHGDLKRSFEHPQDQRCGSEPDPTSYPDDSVTAWARRDRCCQVDRDWHDEALVVVGVFPDQVDPSRCSRDDHGLAVESRRHTMRSVDVP